MGGSRCPRVLTIGVEWLPEGIAFGHGHGQDEVLEAGDAEQDGVLVVGQVLGRRHCAVQGDIPGPGDTSAREAKGGSGHHPSLSITVKTSS